MVLLPYLLVFTFQAVVAVDIGVAYAIPWAGIPMGLAAFVTGLRYYKLRSG
jgi:hypothetical protein